MAEFNLQSICGEHLAQYFKGIDLDSFVNLRPDQIKEAVPNVIDRIMFENRFNKFLKSISQKEDDIQSMIIVVPNENDINFGATGDGPIFDDNFDVFNGPSTGAPRLSTDTHKQSKKTIAIRTLQDIIDIPDIELKIVISKYRGKEIPMPNNDRTVVGKSVIHHLLVSDYNRIIAKPEFTRLAELIVQLFPFEDKGTYYTPAVSRRAPAHGKLIAAYQNYRVHLRAAGLINREESYESEEEVEKGLLEEKSEALKFLLGNNNDADFEQIRTAWQLCFKERLNFLKELSTFEYTRRFPGLNLSKGYELLILDAETLYPSLNSKLPGIASKIVDFLSRESKKRAAPLELKNLMLEYNEFIVDVAEQSDEINTLQQLTALRSLPFLMPNPKRKLSKTEVAKFFCPYFKTPTEAERFNVAFNRDYKNTTAVVLPRLYFVGALPNPCAKIRIGDIVFHVENAIVGFEILVKSFLALKCEYPDQVKHVWKFIEQELYEINSGTIKEVSSVQTFIKDLKYHINNSS